jgi:hypothetical protein
MLIKILLILQVKLKYIKHPIQWEKMHLIEEIQILKIKN